MHLTDGDIETVQRFYSNALPPSNFLSVQNYWKPQIYIHTQNDVAEASPRPESHWTSAMWAFEKTGNFYRIRNRKTGEYLHLENGDIEAGAVRKTLRGAQWQLLKVPFDQLGSGDRGITFTIANRKHPDRFLHIEPEEPQAEFGALQAGPVEAGWHSSWWRLTGIE